MTLGERQNGGVASFFMISTKLSSDMGLRSSTPWRRGATAPARRL